MSTEDLYVDDDGNIIEQPAAAPTTTTATDTPTEGGTEATTNNTPVEDDTRLSATDDDDDNDDRPIEGEDPERAALRERRREEKKRRRANHREREDALRREIAARDEVLAQQQARLDAIERRNTGSEVAQLDAAIRKSVEDYNQYKQLVQQATDAADGKTMGEAMERMMEARNRAEQLTNLRRQYTAQGTRQQQQPALDPRIRQHAEQWMSRNEWYDPQGRDPDSRIALTIDQTMAEEGWTPTTSEYWEELDARLKKYLPHRTKPSYNSPQGKPRSVVGGSGRDSSASTTGYRLSADRVQAIKDAGKWDDPKERADMIKRYREYDKQRGQA